ncbi:MAG: ABC transporter ATP-binding protein [Planctomycetaceae bacterium]|nr:ABC transporter ATP-binding protein [Planctomycetaceae bacterium]
MTDAVIQMHNVTKRFGEKTVLDGLTYSLRPGTVTGLLGTNGSGKTTMLKCALGLQTTQEGISTVFGEPSTELSAASKARLAYVPQEISLYPWMKVRQIIAYIRAFYPRWNDQLIARLVSEWNLPVEDRVGTLSTGQAQKLAIVMALGHEPELLVLDEPVASLDPDARRRFLATLLEIAMSGNRTVLFSTHITSDLERVADQVALLQDGKISYDDELSSLKDSVKRLRISVPGRLPDDLEAIPGLLNCDRNGTSAVVSVRNFETTLPQRLRQEWQAEVNVEDLNLEEIFLELHHSPLVDIKQ